jgi:hypothetical protein
VALPIEQDGPAPQVVADDLFVALQTAAPVEQSVAPVWHAALMPVVQAAPAVQALQVPVASQTPAAVPAMHPVATGTRAQVPVEHVWQAPHVVAQQMPAMQWPFAHWLSAEQGLPSAMVGAHAPPEPQ